MRQVYHATSGCYAGLLQTVTRPRARTIALDL
jgi:hypothetical protein